MFVIIHLTYVKKRSGITSRLDILSMPVTQRKGLVGNMISVHRVFILTATTLLVMSLSHRVDTLGAADMAETSAKEGKMVFAITCHS